MKKITSQEILHFFRQLSVLVSAGISLMKSLDLLAQAVRQANFRSLIQGLRRDLESGREFNSCLRRYPLLFDLFTCQLIRIGEQTGTLDRTLHRVALHKEKTHKLQKELKQALIYPAVILAAALLSTLILLLFVVPQFASLFEHFPSKMPLPTQILIRIAANLRQLLPWLGLFSGLGVLAFFHFRKAALLHSLFQRLIFQLPLMQKLALQFALVSFSRTLAVILSAGLPLTEALLMVAQLSPFDEFKEDILKIHAGVSAGKRLSLNLWQLPYFPPLLTQMTRIGEEAGSLDRMLEKFAEITETELEQKLSRLKLLLEPLIIAILGVLIGGIVIAMYLPVFRLGTAIS